jgi:hypothetical protein
MTDAQLLSAVGQSSDLYERYRSRAFAALSTDTEVQAAQRDWVAFLTRSHGTIFDDSSVENPRDALFVETLYYDFVVEGIIESIQHEFGVQVLNRESTENTDALSVSFRSLHERILGSDTLDHPLASRLDLESLVQSSLSILRALYEAVVSREMRRRLGAYYTPRGVADLAVSELGVTDHRSETFLDPGCGSGVFLTACIDAKRDALDDCDPETLIETITSTVFGIDLDPIAVKSAKVSYLLALGPLLAESDIDRLELPVFLTDALALTRDDEIRFGGSPISLTVDHLVGNPPWITWGDLPETVRDAWREQYIDHLNLFPQEGIEARLGHGNDDISVPFVGVCIHRYLDEGGDASFVLKRDIMKGPAGRLLRTQQVGSRPVAVTHIHDFNQLHPFEAATVQSAIYTMGVGREPNFPIPVDSWSAGENSADFSTPEAMRETVKHETVEMVPLCDDRDSLWVRADASTRALGDCHHDIRHGVKDDAKDVFSIDRDQLSELEHDHVYPYLRSKHIVKYGLFGHDLHLVPLEKTNVDNEAELEATCPNTHEYFSANRERLESRSSSWLQSGTFYNLFGLGEYTWTAYKIVWCRLGFKPHFAVVSTRHDPDLGEKMVVPGDHCMFIATDDRYEAHFLCGLLNSAIYQQSLREIASEGKASLSKAVVSKLSLPEYEPTADTERLAELSMAAHDIVPEHTNMRKRTYNETPIPELEALQAEMDACVESLLD